MARPAVWRQRNFARFWAGETVSLLGSQVTMLALPLTAALMLGATPSQMGVLGMLQTLPYLLIGLPAGAWVDRLPRRTVLIVTDLGRAGLLATVPIAALLGMLRLELLNVIAFLTGLLSVFFSVAYGAFLPAVVARSDLVEANAKLALGEQVARVSGPGLAGILVQVVTAPLAIAVDACSFVVSAVFLSSLSPVEASPPHRSVHGTLLQEIREGLSVVVQNPFLRALTVATALGNFGDGLLFGSGAFVLYATRELGLEPSVLGGLLVCLGAGGVLGAVVAGRITKFFGFGLTVMATVFIWAVGALLLGLTYGPPSVVAPILGALFIGVGVVSPIFNTNMASLRQAITPDRLLGRVTGTSRFVTWGLLPVGALVGGWLGEAVGLRVTVFAAAGMIFVALLLLLGSPVRALRSLPTAG